ncbi:MAG: porin [Alphaproteobacteria bacterium]|nr:porin [Alphaproteobacteria bacterium]
MNKIIGRASWIKGLMVATALTTVVAMSLPSSNALASEAEDIAALKKENAELHEMVKDLAQNVKVLQESVKHTAEVVATPKSPAKMATSGNESVSLAVSGQGNRMLFYANDGDQAKIFNADNKLSTSRLNVTGKAKLDDDATVGATIEVELNSNRSSSVTMRQETENNAGASLTERKSELFLESKSFGKLSLGQGSVATDGVSETDLSGTSVIAFSSLGTDMGAALLFRLKGTPTSLGRTVSTLFDNFDASRLDRVRYDTPDVMGFVASASYADADINDYALRFNKEVSGYKVAAAIGYDDSTNQVTGLKTVNGSAGIKAPFGTSLQGGYAERSFETVGRNDAEFWYAKIGHEISALLPFGATTFSIDHAETTDQALNNSEGNWWNFAAVQNIKKAATELYFNVGRYNVDIPNIATDNIWIAGVGARVKF